MGAEAARLAEAGERAVYTVSADERAATEHLPLEVRDELHLARPDAHLRAARAWRRRRASRRLYGRARAPTGSGADLVGPFHWMVRERHARHRHGRLQRQVLVRSPGDTAHRAAADDRTMDPAELRHHRQRVHHRRPGRLFTPGTTPLHGDPRPT